MAFILSKINFFNIKKPYHIFIMHTKFENFTSEGGGQVVRWCWANFQCRGVLLIWIRVGQGPSVPAVGAVGVVWTFFLSSIISLSFSLSLWETSRYRLKYCLKGPLSPKQPTNQLYLRKCMGGVSYPIAQKSFKNDQVCQNKFQLHQNSDAYLEYAYNTSAKFEKIFI